MLRIVQQSSVEGAKSYFKASKGSGRGAYYAEGGDALGAWGGDGAQMLGLDGPVKWKEFERLCENRHPLTGEKLTPMTRRNRRVGYDVSFHAPKSFSLMAEWALDPDLKEALFSAVLLTMKDLEKEARSRMRLNGIEDGSRVTGNLTYATFLHRTTRPLDDGEPDPHWHIHAFVFNATYDAHPEEERWKALDFSECKKMARFFEASFHARLTYRLRELGYPITRSKKGWEISGISEDLRKKFSRRTKEIEELAEKLKIRSPLEKAKLGAMTRNSKKAARAENPEDLRASWAGRMTHEERESLSVIQRNKKPLRGVTGFEEELTARALERSTAHHFERSSTVPLLWLLETALRWGLGWVTPEGIRAEAQRNVEANSLLAKGEKVTLPLVLQEELQLVDLAKNGRGKVKELLPLTGDTSLTPEQQKALNGLLASRDQVSLLIGRAGAGKTTLLKTLNDALLAQGYALQVFAPTAEASRGVLRKEGFHEADTVAKLLQVIKSPQGPLRFKSNVVLLIDEAGLLPMKQALELLTFANQKGLRVILSGDPFQHHSVERGDVLQLLRVEAGLVPQVVKDIKRQRGDYKRAVTLLADGETERAIQLLEKMGWVLEEPDLEKRVRRVAKDYARLLGKGSSLLVISPTNIEGSAVTLAIREELRDRGLLKDERSVRVLTPLKLTEAEKGDPSSYLPGDVFLSHRGTKEVYRPEELLVAVGDKVKITKNTKSVEGVELRNGSTFVVTGFLKDGSIALGGKVTLPQESFFFTHGYVTTSYSSQGKTVDHVLVIQSKESRGATSLEQAYVSISRGRDTATIYTDDKNELLSMIRRSEAEHRESAVSLLSVIVEQWRGFKHWLAERALRAVGVSQKLLP